MSSQGLPKMSLVAQYDDLCRYTSILTVGSETEFKTFVEIQLNFMRKWKESVFKIRNLNDKLSRLESEKDILKTQLEHLKYALNDALSARKQIEADKDSLAKKIATIVEVLSGDVVMDNQTKQQLVLLSSTHKTDFNSQPRLQTIEESVGSLFSLSDIDQTDDNLENHQSSSRHRRQSHGKRSSSESRASIKKKKFEDIEKSPNEVNDVYDAPSINAELQSKTELSFNTPITSSGIHEVHKSSFSQSKHNAYDLRKLNTRSLSVSTPIGHYNNNPNKKINRRHDFVTKTNFFRIKCNPCGQNIGYVVQALKCQNCRMNCHVECKEKCPLPCFPIVNTPTKGSSGSIADYTSSVPPMIPPLIVHCVNEIERRGLNKELGLYRLSGSEREVKCLKEKFVRGRTFPSLINIDIHAICGTVKEFLRSLKEPLITHNAWQAFVNAAALKNRALDTLYEIVNGLPQPNRDTLSFLILHLQKIAESPECKMNIDNLAKVFGPTIIGYSVANPADMNLLNETPQQHQVMKQLLSISSDSWKNILGVELNVFQDVLMKTPENLPAPKGTRLGPLYVSLQNTRNMNVRKNQQISKKFKT